MEITSYCIIYESLIFLSLHPHLIPKNSILIPPILIEFISITSSSENNPHQLLMGYPSVTLPPYSY